MKKLTKEEIGKLGIYEFQGYIGAMTSPTFGGWDGTDKLIEFLQIKTKKNLKLLEVGCSTGYITRYMAQHIDCTIIGVDSSELLINIAEEEASKLNISSVSFQCAKVENLPFPDNTFDIVYGEAITALVTDPIQVINEYKRVLKSGGKIGTLDLFMNESLGDEFVEETTEIMSNVIGTKVKIRSFQEWQHIFREIGLSKIEIFDFYDDLFKRTYSFGKMVKIMVKMLYYIVINKEIRNKIYPTLKFARKFQKLLKGDNFGYHIFIGIK